MSVTFQSPVTLVKHKRLGKNEKRVATLSLCLSMDTKGHGSGNLCTRFKSSVMRVYQLLCITIRGVKYILAWSIGLLYAPYFYFFIINIITIIYKTGLLILLYTLQGCKTFEKYTASLLTTYWCNSLSAHKIFFFR